MKSFIRLSVAITVLLLNVGCSMIAPNYSASIKNIEVLKAAGDFSAKIGQFESLPAPENANPISLRGSSLKSPYGNSYSDYLAEAIIQELSLAGKLSSSAKIEISGVLQRNDIDATGFSVGTGEIGARFVVKNGESVQYDRVKSVTHQWESSFVGGIAIPKAQNEYPNLVQKLLATLYSDPDFVVAITE